MKLVVLTSLILAGTLLAARSHARADIPGGFDVQAWNAWLNTVIQTGTAGDMPDGIHMVVTKIQPPDTSKDHQVDDFSVVGSRSPQGSFVVNHIEVVSEKWTIDTDGTRHADQWLFQASPLGDVTRVMHMHLVEAKDGGFISDDPVATTPEESMAIWISELNLWYAVTSGGGTAPGTRPSPLTASAQNH